MIMIMIIIMMITNPPLSFLIPEHTQSNKVNNKHKHKHKSKSKKKNQKKKTQRKNKKGRRMPWIEMKLTQNLNHVLFQKKRELKNAQRGQESDDDSESSVNHDEHYSTVAAADVDDDDDDGEKKTKNEAVNKKCTATTLSSKELKRKQQETEHTFVDFMEMFYELKTILLCKDFLEMF
ncbi:hypothetical protein RFI_37290, partial [Reticulomyxa filosa]